MGGRGYVWGRERRGGGEGRGVNDERMMEQWRSGGWEEEEEDREGKKIASVALQVARAARHDLVLRGNGWDVDG